MKKNILFFPLTGTNWSVMSRLALEMKASGKCRPILLISNRLVANLASDSNLLIDTIYAANLKAKLHAKLDIGIRKSLVNTQFFHRIIVNLSDLKLFRYFFILQKKSEISHNEAELNAIFSRFSPSAIVVSGDRNSGIEPIALKIARERQIRSIIPPIAFPASVDGLLIVRRNRLGHDVTRNTWFKKMYPNQWVKDDVSKKDISFFSPTLTQAYDELSILSPNPWVMGAGLSDAILADSEYVRDCYLKAGVKREKIKITGHLDHDLVAHSLARKNVILEKLAHKYHFDPSKKVIMLLLTNWMEHNFATDEWHWRECNFLCEVAQNQNASVLISLHPTQKRINYLHLTKKFPNICILEEPLSQVLGVSDLMLTGMGSSTVLWAVMAGIPVVIADHYQEKDHLHKGLPGVQHIENRKELNAVVTATLADKVCSNTLQADNKLIKSYYGQLDMKNTKRIIDFICDLK